MKILLLEPFFSGSHRRWAEGYQHSSQHNVEIFSLKGRHWKWRMHGGAVSLAQQYINSSFKPDLILATDMLDLSTFIALTRTHLNGIPIAIYFHENQITYPWSPNDQDVKLKRNNQYGFINYTSALAADHIFFNSSYHYHSFLDGLNPFLKQFPDERNLDSISDIRKKSSILSLGLDLKKHQQYQQIFHHSTPIILWNHRWEYDKNPTLFFNTLFQLKNEAIDFKLVVLGASYGKIPTIFQEAFDQLNDRILYWGFAENEASYAHWLWKSDILAVTCNQDFFGGSVVEAIYCNCYPLLPFRLAYPEHIPEEFHSRYFYHDDVAFYTHLKKLLLSPNLNKQTKSLENFVAHYDWSTLAAHYDQVLSNIELKCLN